MRPSRLEPILGIALSLRRRDTRSDAELLAQFLDHRDEEAFAILVVRHTSAVRASCRGWLRAIADIDDACQAVFLVLAQRAISIRNRAAVGPWLYRVADNVARRMRKQQSRFGPLTEDVPHLIPAVDDLGELLAEEVARLPEKYRLPVQLCYATGLTTAEAAERLGWAKGTVLTRLAWARRRLQKSLASRGFAPTTAQLTLPVLPAVSTRWMSSTARAVIARCAGQTPVEAGISTRAILIAEGVVRAMMWNKVKYVALAALVTAGVVGFGIGQWSSANAGAGFAADPRGNQKPAPVIANDREATAKADDVKPAAGRRREAVIRAPLGTFVKEVEVAPYGSGRLTWTYDDERVSGLIEGSVLGGQFELATEAEYSLASTGVIYGVLTSVRLNHLKLPDGGEYEKLKPFVGLWPAVEPVVNEVLVDLPFSYRFHVQGDRLVISNFRILLAGPNPLGKLGALAVHDNEAGKVLAMFQAFGTAMEGTYTSAEAKEKPPQKARFQFSKPGK